MFNDKGLWYLLTNFVGLIKNNNVLRYNYFYKKICDLIFYANLAYKMQNHQILIIPKSNLKLSEISKLYFFKHSLFYKIYKPVF